MNPGQEMFFNFILDRVQDGKQADAKALLTESFAKQAAGEFDGDYIQHFGARMVAILKPECVQEVQAIMAQYGTGEH